MIYAILFVKNNPEKLIALLEEVKGIDGKELYAVFFDEIGAVVSDTNKSEIIADSSSAIKYANVIEMLAQQFTLLPMRYGSVIESNDAIKKMIEKNYHEIQLNLQKVENKFEFGLKVICDSEKLKSELNAKSVTQIQVSDNQGTESPNSVYRDWVNKKLKEHRIEEQLLVYVDSIIAVITETLARLNVIHKFKKMATASIMVDSVFLVDKESKNALIDAVKDLQDQYPELNFVLTGPWPPYNFVNFAVK